MSGCQQLSTKRRQSDWSFKEFVFQTELRCEKALHVLSTVQTKWVEHNRRKKKLHPARQDPITDLARTRLSLPLAYVAGLRPHLLHTLSRGNLLWPSEARVILWEPTRLKLLERRVLMAGSEAAGAGGGRGKKNYQLLQLGMFGNVPNTDTSYSVLLRNQYYFDTFLCGVKLLS